jgi:ParB family chromosome partitioning protein
MAKKRAPAKRRPRKQKPGTRGLAPAETRLETLGGDAQAVAERIERVGGHLLGSYHDPLGKQPVLVAILPIGSVEPTPFQRDLSQVHHRKLADVLDRTGMFLDPIIAVTAPGEDQGFWTPNGMHRLMAMRRLGARAITALVIPKREIAWQILALNTEKAHNLREKALEVIRIYRGLLDEDDSRAESGFSFYLEEASLVTLGICYEKNGKFAGGAYNPIVRRLETFSEEPIGKAIRTHEKRAQMLMELDERVSEAVKKLKEKGFVSPYLRAFVVARINPLRWIQGDPPPLDEVLKTMRERAAKFNVDKIKQSDLANVGGAADDQD